MTILQPDPWVLEQKAVLRAEAKLIRAGLDSDVRARASYRACRAIIDSPQFKNARIVALYAAIDDEADPIHIEDAAEDRVILYPRVDGRHLEFRRARRRELVKSSFGIPEPTQNHAFFEVAKSDLIIVPGLRFARNGFRMGYGKGYYDRALRRVLALAHPTPPLSIGFGFSAQIIDELPTTPYDEPVRALATESGLTILSG